MQDQSEAVREIAERIQSLIDSARADGLHHATSHQIAQFAFGVDGDFNLFVNGINGRSAKAPLLAVYALDQTGNLVYADEDPVEELIASHCPRRAVPGEGLVADPDAPGFPVNLHEMGEINDAVMILHHASQRLHDYMARRKKANPL